MLRERDWQALRWFARQWTLLQARLFQSHYEHIILSSLPATFEHLLPPARPNLTPASASSSRSVQRVHQVTEGPEDSTPTPSHRPGKEPASSNKGKRKLEEMSSSRRVTRSAAVRAALKRLSHQWFLGSLLRFRLIRTVPVSLKIMPWLTLLNLLVRLPLHYLLLLKLLPLQPLCLKNKLLVSLLGQYLVVRLTPLR